MSSNTRWEQFLSQQSSHDKWTFLYTKLFFTASAISIAVIEHFLTTAGRATLIISLCLLLLLTGLSTFKSDKLTTTVATVVINVNVLLQMVVLAVLCYYGTLEQDHMIIFLFLAVTNEVAQNRIQIFRILFTLTILYVMEISFKRTVPALLSQGDALITLSISLVRFLRKHKQAVLADIKRRSELKHTLTLTESDKESIETKLSQRDNSPVYKPEVDTEDYHNDPRFKAKYFKQGPTITVNRAPAEVGGLEHNTGNAGKSRLNSPSG